MTPHETALAALRVASYEVAGFIDGDHIELWRDARGGSQAAMWRPFWIYIARIALDIPEADLARALTEQMTIMGFKDPEAPEVHHSSIADMCHRVVDICARSAKAEARLERMCERALEQWHDGGEWRADLEAAVHAHFAAKDAEKGRARA